MERTGIPDILIIETCNKLLNVLYVDETITKGEIAQLIWLHVTNAKKGHFASQCLSKSVSEVDTTKLQTLFKTAFLGAVGADTENVWFSTIQLLGRLLSFKLDMGAEVTPISKSVFRSLPQVELRPINRENLEVLYCTVTRHPYRQCMWSKD